MNRWILQMGFPVVTIDTRTGKITQEHFLLDPESVVDRPSEFKQDPTSKKKKVSNFFMSLNAASIRFHVLFRGFGSSYEWFVPLTWIKKGGSEQQFWFLSKEGQIHYNSKRDGYCCCLINSVFSSSCSVTNPDLVVGDADWLVANINMKGFYRVNYDEANWERLIAKLSSNDVDMV